MQRQSVIAKEIKISKVDWDSFAMACEASYRGLHAWIKFRQLRSHIFFRDIRYGIFLLGEGGAQTKIGQFAIGIGPRNRIFADGLQLLPEYTGLWVPCMQAVLNKLGPGQYLYGSDWSLEPPRENQLAALQGVTVTHVDRHMVEAVDLARWGSWSEYERSISTNVRRNIKKAREKYENTYLEIRRGIDALVYTAQIVYSRSKMLSRKMLSLDLAGIVKNHLMRSTCLPDYTYTAILRANGKILATLGGAEVGRHAYYFDGGTNQTDGSGWLLMMSLIEDFYKRHPNGRFVMGSSYRDDDQIDGWNSSARYRRDARVSGFPTSVVTFTVS
jgi:hypothetical protein